MDEIIQHFDERNEEHLYQVHPEIIEIERPDPKRCLRLDMKISKLVHHETSNS